MRRTRTLGVLFVLWFTASCGTTAGSDGLAATDASVDASSGAPPLGGARAEALIDETPPLVHLRSLAAVRRRLDPEAGLSRVGSGYMLSGNVPSGARVGGRFQRVDRDRLVASVPERSSGVVHVGVRGANGEESAWFEIASEDVRSAPAVEGVIDHAAVTFRGVLPHTDVVHVLEPGRVEELRVVHAPTDEVVVRHRLHVGQGLHAFRMRANQDVEAVDEQGKAVLESDSIVAWDATGKELATSVRVIEDGRDWILETRVPTRGAKFPVTVDPTFSPVSSSAATDPYPAYAFPYAGSQNWLFVGSGGTPTLYDPYTTAPLDPFTAKPAPTWGGNPIQLADGTILYTQSASGAFIYDPVAGTSTKVGNMNQPHDYGVTARLLDGRVAILGSAIGTGSTVPNLELFNVSTQSWTLVAQTPFASSIAYQQMTALDNGKLLISGAKPYSAAPLNPVVFDPSALSSMASAGTVTYPRYNHLARKLANGNVLLVGGECYGPSYCDYLYTGGTADLYVPGADPSKDTLTTLSSKLTYGRYLNNFTMTQLVDGRWLIAGGSAFETAKGSSASAFATGETEYFDPTTLTFSVGPTMAYTHIQHAAALLPGGRVLMYGGLQNGSGGSGKLEMYIPDAVTDPGSCSTGIMADGYCCDRACAGPCEACNLPGTLGVCTPVVGAQPAGHGPSCAPFLCGGANASGVGVCATKCGSDAGCVAGDYCDALSSQCVPLKAQAQGCSRNGECTSGACVDGYCCNSLCNSKVCQACNVPGSVGTCTDVASGDPQGTHGSCGSYACSAGQCVTGSCGADTDCATHRYCVAGACTTALGIGTSCLRNAQCQSGFCIDNVCCNSGCGAACQACNVAGSMGTCSNVATGAPHGARTCAPYATCTAGACNSTCSADGDCASGYGCSAGHCVVRKANGASCALGTECASNTCADGVCCNSGCGGACQACNLTGSIGTCTAVDGATDPHGVCATGPCGSTCKAGACGFKATGTSCGTAACSAGVLTTATCDGASATCPSAAPSPCPGHLACASALTCNTSCLVDADCMSGICNVATHTCGVHKSDGASCSTSGECTSGVCTDGVCCHTACGGACQACNLPSSLGTCAPVDGAPDPHGLCATGPCSDMCRAGACAVRPSGTACGTATCTANKLSVSVCDGASPSCPASVPTPCPGSLGCGASGLCKASCAADADCAVGTCDIASGACVLKKANGASCALAGECASGSCADGVCCDVACNGACQACNLTGTTGKCTAVDAMADPNGRCPIGECADVCSKGTCQVRAAGSSCATKTCASGVLSQAQCDGASATCPAPVGTPCANNLACASASACKSSCLGDGDCTSGVCDPTTKTCIAAPVDAGVDAPSEAAPDAPPDADAQADVVDASTEAAPDASVDVADGLIIAEVGAPTLPVVPSVSGFQRCTKHGECASGFCVEGVCCNTACEDQCYSCALLSNPGVCTLEPIGVDLKNECGPGLSCLGTCGGNGQCIGAGTGTECARNHCTGPSTGLGAAYCRAHGAQCPTDDAVEFDCANYACEPAFGACLTSCSATSECAPGKLCDVASSTCVSPPDAAQSNSCSVGTPGARGEDSPLGARLAVFGLLALAVYARKRMA